MSRTVFGDRIRKLRLNNNLSMEELACALNVTKSRINMWENGNVVPRNDLLLRLSTYFNVSTDYLLGNDSMDGLNPVESETLHFLQRGLKGLDEEQLKKAKNILVSVFDDVFESDKE